MATAGVLWGGGLTGEQAAGALRPGLLSPSPQETAGLKRAIWKQTDSGRDSDRRFLFSSLQLSKLSKFLCFTF